ncbi:MAG: flagellar motor switch protein FliG [Betaproteobacteria bacterium]|nr:flagellar motor switch protein FliG [Betaproteobacteria bacterium]
MSEDGLTNSAILLMSLGEEEAAEVMKFLTPKEVQKLGQTMSKVKGVTREKIDSVLSVFEAESQGQTALGMDSDVYLRSVLNKALGPEKASFILDRILQGGDTSGIESLKWMDAASVAELIKNEHPQIIASVLVHLERDHACEILAAFTDRLRSDVVLRIATLDGIQPTALRELNDVLAKVLAGSENLKKAALGGARTAAEIMNFMNSALETGVIDSVREYDPELAQKILDEMFVFENILEIDDRGIQLVLREVQSESLIVALKGASEPLREKIFKNMSQRAAEMLKDDLESKGPVRISEVETEQKEILKVVRRLSDEGQIAMGGKGEEAYV